jgi:hypothetical protein
MAEQMVGELEVLFLVSDDAEESGIVLEEVFLDGCFASRLEGY